MRRAWRFLLVKSSAGLPGLRPRSRAWPGSSPEQLQGLNECMCESTGDGSAASHEPDARQMVRPKPHTSWPHRCCSAAVKPWAVMVE